MKRFRHSRAGGNDGFCHDLLSILTPHARQAFSKEHGLGRRRKLPGFYLPNRHTALMQTALLAIFLIVSITSVPCVELPISLKFSSRTWGIARQAQTGMRIWTQASWPLAAHLGRAKAAGPDEPAQFESRRQYSRPLGVIPLHRVMDADTRQRAGGIFSQSAAKRSAQWS